MSGHRNKTGVKTKQKQTLVKIVIITFQTISVIKWNQGTLDMSQYQTKECPLKSMNRVH